MIFKTWIMLKVLNLLVDIHATLICAIVLIASVEMNTDFADFFFFRPFGAILLAKPKTTILNQHTCSFFAWEITAKKVVIIDTLVFVLFVSHPLFSLRESQGYGIFLTDNVILNDFFGFLDNLLRFWNFLCVFLVPGVVYLHFLDIFHQFLISFLFSKILLFLSLFE